MLYQTELQPHERGWQESNLRPFPKREEISSFTTDLARCVRTAPLRLGPSTGRTGRCTWLNHRLLSDLCRVHYPYPAPRDAFPLSQGLAVSDEVIVLLRKYPHSSQRAHTSVQSVLIPRGPLLLLRALDGNNCRPARKFRRLGGAMQAPPMRPIRDALSRR